MTLVTLKSLITHAQEHNYAVGAFSVASSEMILGAIHAAEALQSPMILQIAEVRLKQSPLHIIGPAMVAAAKAANVPVAVHFDHGLTEKKICEALEIGFTSIMFDGSHHILAENIRQSKNIAQIVSSYGASFEAEIGQVGGSEDGSENIEMRTTSLVEAQAFVQEVPVDALAVAIGNAHGIYQGTAQLQFDKLAELQDNLQTALVLHGGSGLTEQDFHACIDRGIRKINVATSTFHLIRDFVNRASSFHDYYDLHEQLILGAQTNIERHIKMFKSDGKVV